MNKIVCVFALLCFCGGLSVAQIEPEMSSAEIAAAIEGFAGKKISAKIRRNFEAGGESFANEKKYQEAEQIYRFLLSVDNSKKQEFLYNVKIGDIYVATDNINQAISFYETAGELYPKNIEIPIKLGNMFLDDNLFYLAQRKFLEAMAINKRSPQAKTGLGDVFFKQGRYHQALTYYESIETNQVTWQTFVNILLCYRELDLVHALVLINTSPRFWTADEYFVAGTIYYQLKDYANASKEFLGAIAIEKDSYPAFLYLALIALNENNLQQALDYLNTAKSIADEISSIDFLYAQVFFKQKDYAKAKEYAQRAAQKNNPGTFIYQQSQNFISVINEKLK